MGRKSERAWFLDSGYCGRGLHHPHVHCVIPAGGLSPDRKAWIHPRYRFFLPRGVLRKVFRGKFVDGLKRAFSRGELFLPGVLQSLADEKAFRAFLRTLYRHQWVVHIKRPFGSPQYVLKYLAHYTHRVAISNHRLVGFACDKVTFRWKDYKNGAQHKLMTLDTDEFLRRFLLHTLPPGFVRIRFFGFMANRRRSVLLPLCSQLLGASSQQPEALPSQHCPLDEHPTWLCPLCSGPMIVIERFTAQQLFMQALKEQDLVDTS